MRFVVTVVVASMLATSPAMARNFAGPRAEVRLGVEVPNSDLSEKFRYTDYYGYTENFERSLSSGGAGFSYGLGLGYDFAVSERVIGGFEASLDFSDAKNCAGMFYHWSDFCLKAGRDFGLGMRVGVIVAPSSLLYVKAGYANGRIKLRGWDEVWRRPLSESKTLDGLRIGGGLETALSAKLFVKLEYSYADYEGWDRSFADRGYSSEAHFDLDRHKTLAVVGMRF